MTIFEENNLLTSEQAADMLGIKLATFRIYYSKKFNNVKVRHGSRVYIPKAALEEFILLPKN